MSGWKIHGSDHMAGSTGQLTVSADVYGTIERSFGEVAKTLGSLPPIMAALPEDASLEVRLTLKKTSGQLSVKEFSFKTDAAGR